MDITLILLYSKPRIERCDFVRLNSIVFELTKLGTYIVGFFFFQMKNHSLQKQGNIFNFKKIFYHCADKIIALLKFIDC